MERNWLVKFRESKGLTQEEVADNSQIKRPYYTMIENGSRRPSVQVAQNIGSALGFEWTLFFEQKCNESTHRDNTA